MVLAIDSRQVGFDARPVFGFFVCKLSVNSTLNLTGFLKELETVLFGEAGGVRIEVLAVVPARFTDFLKLEMR